MPIPTPVPQLPSRPVPGPLPKSAHNLKAAIEERGAVYTRREVVDFILDLAGYTTDKPLHTLSILEPSFGEGDFLLPIIERLLTAWTKQAGADGDAKVDLRGAIRAVELHGDAFDITRSKVVSCLAERGIKAEAAAILADSWLIHDDYLLTEFAESFDFVVGNPPYVRQELIPNALLAEYRARYATIYDRADLYIPFMERSLKLLKEGGRLGFICSDRWMKNRYGGPLRSFVSGAFHLKTYVDMVNTPAFHSDVIAYPAITIIIRQDPGPTRIAHRPAICAESLRSLSSLLLAQQLPEDNADVREIAGVAAGSQPWILESSDQLALVRRLEAEFPTLEEAGCKVGIGVATGADKAFIAPFESLDVEPDRKLPIVMTRDITGGTVKWRGFGVINPFRDDGGLVDLDSYPKLKKYLESHRDLIAKRHVAKKSPANWYRTIDRIYPAIAKKQKLLIPDIKGTAQVVFEEGALYPHHNLYYITSDEWNLKALQAVLLSGIARLFVSIYSTQMHGGFLRFQAQYLRRIRIPRWSEIPDAIRNELIGAAEKRDYTACNKAVHALFGMTQDERMALGGNGE